MGTHETKPETKENQVQYNHKHPTTLQSNTLCFESLIDTLIHSLSTVSYAPRSLDVTYSSLLPSLYLATPSPPLLLLLSNGPLNLSQRQCRAIIRNPMVNRRVRTCIAFPTIHTASMLQVKPVVWFVSSDPFYESEWLITHVMI